MDRTFRQQGSPLFAIRQKIVSSETTEGTVFLLGPLDFEKQAMYHLTILANVSNEFEVFKEDIISNII